jgi:thiol-disulfide isomerase/thioredoxin
MNKQLLIENLEKKNNIILYFNSGGCGPCMQAKPLVKKIAESKKGYSYADITEGSPESEELGKFCGVEFYPTLVIIEDSKVNRYVGLNEIKTL